MAGDENGYIKTYRKMKSWEWYKNIPVKVTFQHCLLMANRLPKKLEGTLIESGSFVTSFEVFASECGLTVQQVRTSLKKLKSTCDLTYTSTNKGTLINIVKWADYQGSDTDTNMNINMPSNNQITNDQQTDNKRITTNKKYRSKEIKNKDIKHSVVGVFESYSNGNNELLQALNNFEEMRKSSKKPMTDKAKQLLCTAIDGVISKGDNAIECINQSIMNNWLSVYPMSKKQKRSDREDVLPEFYQSHTTVSEEEKEKMKERIKALGDK